MTDYPETFDPTGPGSEDPYYYVNWAAVSVHRVLAAYPETSWEALPDLLGQVWGVPDWYQRNEWLADFYTTVYEHANGLDPVHVFTVDELGEPATDLARVIDAVVQSWLSPVQPVDPGYADGDGATYADEEQWSGYADQHPGHDPAAADDPGRYDVEGHDPAYADEPVDGPGGSVPEPLTDLDPDVARAALARVTDDEADDLSPEDQQILATVLTVEEFQYLAREFDLV